MHFKYLNLFNKALQYTLPRMKQATNEVSEDLPLFVHYFLEEKHSVKIL